MEEEGNAAEGRSRRDVHDRAGALLAHARDDGLAREEHARDVDVHHLAPLVERDLLERPHRERGVEAGVVDEDVDPAAALERLRRHALGLLLGGDVDAEPDASFELGRRLLGPREIGDDDPRALTGETLGDRASDPLGAAGDDRNLAVEGSH